MSCNSSSAPCGVNAACSDDLSCLCEEGYFRSTDFSLGFYTADCFSNILTLQILYFFAFATVIFATVCYTLALQKVSQVVRLIPFYCCMGICGSVALLKGLDLEKKLVGEDVALTTLLALTILLNSLATTVFLLKYVMINYKFLAFKPVKHEQTLKRKKNVLFVNNVFALVTGLVLIIAPFAQLQETTNKIIQVAFILFSIHAYFLLISVYSLVNELYKELQASRNLLTATRNYGAIGFNVKGVEIVCCVTIGINATFFGVIGLWHTGTQYFIYFIPFLIMSCSLGAIGTLFFNLRGKRLRSKVERKIAETSSRKESSIRDMSIVKEKTLL